MILLLLQVMLSWLRVSKDMIENSSSMLLMFSHSFFLANCSIQRTTYRRDQDWTVFLHANVCGCSHSLMAAARRTTVLTMTAATLSPATITSVGAVITAGIEGGTTRSTFRVGTRTVKNVCFRKAIAATRAIGPNVFHLPKSRIEFVSIRGHAAARGGDLYKCRATLDH